jgi:hypothetical protein
LKASASESSIPPPPPPAKASTNAIAMSSTIRIARTRSPLRHGGSRSA